MLRSAEVKPAVLQICLTLYGQTSLSLSFTLATLGQVQIGLVSFHVKEHCLGSDFVRKRSYRQCLKYSISSVSSIASVYLRAGSNQTCARERGASLTGVV